jgi:hypothetical protein
MNQSILKKYSITGLAFVLVLLFSLFGSLSAQNTVSTYPDTTWIRHPTIEPITCLDALLFAEQNARVAQLERPAEFLASVLKRRVMERDEVVVVFGAGSEGVPPASVHGFEIVDEYVTAGWRYWYLVHNHTRQANGALGVPVPSTSDVRFVRSLAAQRGLERVRVTNGFYTFDASIAEISRFRAR